MNHPTNYAPPMARYLNRSYWEEQQAAKQSTATTAATTATMPTADELGAAMAATSLSATTTATTPATTPAKVTEVGAHFFKVLELLNFNCPLYKLMARTECKQIFATYSCLDSTETFLRLSDYSNCFMEWVFLTNE